MNQCTVIPTPLSAVCPLDQRRLQSGTIRRQLQSSAGLSAVTRFVQSNGSRRVGGLVVHICVLGTNYAGDSLTLFESSERDMSPRSTSSSRRHRQQRLHDRTFLALTITRQLFVCFCALIWSRVGRSMVNNDMLDCTWGLLPLSDGNHLEQPVDGVNAPKDVDARHLHRHVTVAGTDRGASHMI